MVRRNIPHKLFNFMKKEVLQTRALWGELRRVKKMKVMQEGLPNIPKLIITKDPLVSYIVVVRNVRELRIYPFDKLGLMLPAKSYYDEESKQVWIDVQKQSKKLAKFPKEYKPPTPGKRNKELTAAFKRIWNKIIKLYSISKNPKSPLFSYCSEPQNGLWGTKLEGDFVYIPKDTTMLKEIFVFYSFYFLLPLGIRKDKSNAEQISIFLSKRLKLFQTIKISLGTPFTLSFHNWEQYTNQEILNVLYRITDYFPLRWTTERIQALINTPLIEYNGDFFKELYDSSSDIEFLEISLLIEYLTTNILPETTKNQHMLSIINCLRDFEFLPIQVFLLSSEYSKKVEELIQEASKQRLKQILRISKSPEEILLFNQGDLDVYLNDLNQNLPPKTHLIIPNKTVHIEYTVFWKPSPIGLQKFSIEI